MNFHTILHRELVIAARRPTTYYIRSVLAFIAGAMALVAVVLTVRGVIAPDQTGRMLFWTLGGAGMVWVLLEGLMSTVDCISSERREGTLGLLFLSNLKAYDIVAGKMGGAGLRTLFALMAASVAPALTFIFGGVTFGEYLQLVLALLNALFFALSMGALLSVLANSKRLAQARAVVVFVWVLIASPALAGYLYLHKAAILALLITPGPVAPFLVIFAEDPNLNGAFSASFAFSNLIAWTMFAVASRNLSRNWREIDMQRSRRKAALISSRRFKVQGNPIFALSRRRSPDFPKFRTLCLIGITAGALFWFRAPAKNLPLLLGCILLILHAGLSFDVSSAAARLLAESRQSGLLELLLTTPLREDDIAAGHLLALKRSTAKALLALAALGVIWIAIVWHNSTSGEFTMGLSIYVFTFAFHLVELWFNCRVGLWQGLVKGNPDRAYRATSMAQILAMGFGALLTLLIVGSVLPVIHRDYIPTVAGCAGVLLVPAALAVLLARASANIPDKMREVASTPIGLTSSSAR